MATLGSPFVYAQATNDRTGFFLHFFRIMAPLTFDGAE
jgi:hypothetical protein